MPLVISPTIDDITINGHTYEHSDWESNTPGTLGGLGNDLSTKIGALADSLGILTKAISNGTTTLDGTESTNIGFVFTGALTADSVIVFAAGFQGPAQIENQTTGGKKLTCGLVAGNKVEVPPSGSCASFCDGTNFGLESGVVRTSTGARVVGSLEVTGNTVLDGTLHQVGAATFDNAVTVTGGFTGSSTLHLVGVGTFDNDVNVAGDLTGDTLAIAGNSTITGAQTVTGAANFSSNVVVGGNITVSGGVAQFVAPAANEMRVHINPTTAAYSGWLEFDTNSSPRWLTGKNSDAESGSDAGSNYQIVRFNDSGIAQGIPVSIDRKTGVVSLLELPTSAAGLSSGSLWNNAGVLSVA